MHSHKKSLVTIAALTLSVASAHADDNNAFLDQTGMGNSAAINQTGGDKNFVGRSGPRGDWLQQKGDSNQLQVTQTGSQNSVGSNSTGTSGDFLQLGGSNNTSIRQIGDENNIEVITQYSDADDATKNDLVVNQTATTSGNTIGEISQNARTGGDQDDSEPGNSMSVRMTGNANIIKWLRQESDRGALGGQGVLLPEDNSRNLVTIRIEGSNNGANGLEGLADVAGLSGGEYGQYGRGNSMNVAINGTDIQLGVVQRGGSNTFRGLEISGEGNQVGANQWGRKNTVTLLEVSGSENQIGFDQAGNGNTATGFIGNGNYNTVQMQQYGDLNTAILKIQNGGNRNGQAVNMKGVARDLLNATNSGLSAGVMAQWGNNDTATIKISRANNNAFATRQSGGGDTNNEIDVEIAGNKNATAIVQAGDNNEADLSQAGNRNSASILQDGSANRVDLSQEGNRNQSAISIYGDQNILNVTQSGPNRGRARNRMDVSIIGDRNNFNTQFSGFASDALFSARNDAAGFGAGSLVQQGRRNRMTIEVGSQTKSDDNSFAMLQSGKRNTISGRIEGNNNEIVVSQIGNNNFVSFAQVGAFNNAGITQ